MTRADLSYYLLIAVACVVVWFYRREAHFAWSSQGNAIKDRMAANDQLDEVREAFEAGDYARVTEILSRTDHRA